MADLTVTAAKVATIDPLKAEIYSGIAAETITAGKAVYQTTSGTVGIADANVANKQQIRGIALNGGGAGQAIDVLKRGRVYGFTLTDQTYDDPIFLSDTAGALADAAGTLTVPCGLVVAMSDASLTKVLYLDCRWNADWA
jgi:hypothetical protein